MSQVFNMRASGTIVRSRFVSMDPTAPSTGSGSSLGNNVVAAVANGKTIGISDVAGRTPPIPDVAIDPPQAAQAGENVRVHCLGSRCLLEIGTGGCAPGDQLKAASGGTGVVCATGTVGRIGAVAITGAVVGELAEVQVVRFDQVATAS